MGLTKNILKRVDKSQTLKGKLADAFEKNIKTIQRRVDKNDESLTTMKALTIISEELNTPIEELTEE